MKQQLRVFLTLLLCAVASVGWAEEKSVTFVPTDFGLNETVSFDFTKDGIKIEVEGSTTTSDEIRIYKNKTITISSSTATITKIVFNCTANGTTKYGPGCFASQEGYSYEGKVGTWEGSASSVVFTASSNQVRATSIVVTYTTGSGSSLEDNNLSLSPISLEFDLYDDASAKTISYTTSSTGAVTVSASDYVTTEVNETAKTITVTPVAKTSEAQTITVNQAADDNYKTGTATFTVSITDSTPFEGGDVTFDATKDKGNTTAGEGSIEKNGITFSCDNGILGNGSEYRLYKNSVTTFSVTQGAITQIAFTCKSGNPASGFSEQTGWTTEGNNGTWTGNAQSVTFTASEKQVQATKIVVTVDLSATPDPTFTILNNEEIAYNATSGSFDFTVNNPVNDGVTTVSENVDWISNAAISGNNVSFTTTVNNAAASRSGVITLTYTYGTNNETVTKEVTVTQAGNPNITNIPDLFAAANSTAATVSVTFNDWVVSGVSTNGKNVFVTDNNGNGFVIFNSDGGLGDTYAVGSILSGTVSCSLKKNYGYAQLTGVSGLTITTGGSVTEASIEMANLAGVNTGALVSYENLTCSVDNNKYYLTDGTTTIQVYNSLYAFNALEAGKTYNITGVYQQYNNTKEILPRSADDIVKVEVPVQTTITAGTLSYVAISSLYDGDMEDITLGENVAEGTLVYFTLSVDEGYNLESVTVLNANNEEVTLTENQGSWSFTMPNSSVTINATATSSTPATGDKYVKVTSTNDITDGQYLIVYEEGSVAFDGSLETLDVASNTIEVVINNNEIGATDATAAAEFTIDVTAGTLKSASGKYIGVSSNSNGLKQTDEASTYTNGFSIDSDGNAVISAVFDGSTMALRYNKTLGQTRFRYFKNAGQEAIQLFKKVSAAPETVTVTIGSAGLATFCSDKALDFTNSTTVYAYKAVISGSRVNLTKVAKVPAQTGVLLRSVRGGEVDANIPVTTGVEAIDDNAFVAVMTEIASLATETTEDGVTYVNYILNKVNGVTDFYKANGKKVGANKAYLRIDKATASKGISIGYADETDGIRTIGNEPQKVDGIYNLSGQRVNKAQKGIYIVNGKKVVIR